MTATADHYGSKRSPIGAESATLRVSPATVLWLILAGAAAVLALAGIKAPPPLRFSLPLLAHSSGLLAGYGVTVMVALMSRAPALERGVGADRLARWHGSGGRAIFGLILIHGAAATVAWAIGRKISLWTGTLEVLRMP